MKVFNPPSEKLQPELLIRLQDFRNQRHFDPHHCLKAKIAYLENYFTKANLSSAVVAVSGGIDSAVVLGIMAKFLEKSKVLKHVVPVLLPVYDEGATNQLEATKRGVEVALAFNLIPSVIDLTDTQAVLKKAVDKAVTVKGEAWAHGQLVPYTRTPALYYVTSLMNQQGYPSVVVGTTNKDEGSYLGYFGKASDGMVDLQLISDLHKSEVYKMGEILGLPYSVMHVVPTGDMHDGRVDEQVFGAPYDFVELYLHYLDLTGPERFDFDVKLNPEAYEQFNRLGQNLEKLHEYNGHKYKVGSPAYHLDVYSSSTPGGWNHLPVMTVPPKGNFIGEFELNFTPDRFSIRMDDEPRMDYHYFYESYQDGIMTMNLLTPRETNQLIESPKQWVPVGLDGIKSHYKEGDKIGSYRATAYNEDFARVLWNRISSYVGGITFFKDNDSTDLDGSNMWVAVGVNPAMRFIKYEQGGELVAHRDAPFIYDENYRTLKSLVLYLTDSKDRTGLTRFIKDVGIDIPANQRDLKDWTRTPTKEEVLRSIIPYKGTGLIFNHRMIHDSTPIKDDTKIIIRTDIIYRRVI